MGDQARDLSAKYEGESGRVLTRERLFRIGLREGGLSSEGSGYVLNGELYTPVADEGETDDQR